MDEKVKAKLGDFITRVNKSAPDALNSLKTPPKAGVEKQTVEFYFVADKGLSDCVFIVGTDIKTAGKKALLALKKAHGKPVFAEGIMGYEGNYQVKIQKGTAKPIMIKKALKANVLIGSLPGAYGTIAKTWKIMMDPGSGNAPAQTKQYEGADRAARIEVLRTELGADVLSVMEADELELLLNDMDATEAEMPDEEEEALLLAEEAQGLLAAQNRIDEITKALEEGADLSAEQRRKLEAELYDERLLMTIAMPEGEEFDDPLTPREVEALKAALMANLQGLLPRIEVVKQKITETGDSINDPDDETTPDELQAFKAKMTVELNAIKTIMAGQQPSEGTTSPG